MTKKLSNILLPIGFCLFIHFCAFCQKGMGIVYKKSGEQLKGNIRFQSNYDLNLENSAIKSFEVDSVVIDYEKYLSVSPNDTTQFVFVKQILIGHFSLLKTVKNNEYMIAHQDSGIVRLNDKGLKSLKALAYLTKELNTIQMVNLTGIETNESILSRIVNRLNNYFYPNEKTQTIRRKTSVGFYTQLGIASTRVQYQAKMLYDYEGDYGSFSKQMYMPWGIFFQLNTNRRFVYEIGLWNLNYDVKKTASYDYLISKNTDSLYFVLKTIVMPVNVRYNFSLKNNTFFLKAGPQVSFNKTYNSWVKSYFGSYIPNLIYQTKNFLGLNGCFGYSHSLNKMNLGLEYRFSYIQLKDGITIIGKNYTNAVLLNIGWVQNNNRSKRH